MQNALGPVHLAPHPLAPREKRTGLSKTGDYREKYARQTVSKTGDHRRSRHLPVSRDQLVLLMVAINEVFLAVDIYLAHSVSGTIVPSEWIPIIFGSIAGAVMLVAGIIAFRCRPVATVIANIVCGLSVAIGLLGSYFHWLRAILPYAPVGERLTVSLLVWAPPVLAPLTFSLVGVLGFLAAWLEEPAGSGRLRLPGGACLQLPLTKTRAYRLFIGLGILATLISSVLDHARTNFENPWLWVPTATGIFATVVAVALSASPRPTRADLMTYGATMVALIVVGLVGAALHIQADLTSRSLFVPERFIRGAPFLAPLLFANMGTLGLITLLESGKSPLPLAREG